MKDTVQDKCAEEKKFTGWPRVKNVQEYNFECRPLGRSPTTEPEIIVVRDSNVTFAPSKTVSNSKVVLLLEYNNKLVKFGLGQLSDSTNDYDSSFRKVSVVGPEEQFVSGHKSLGEQDCKNQQKFYRLLTYLCQDRSVHLLQWQKIHSYHQLNLNQRVVLSEFLAKDKGISKVWMWYSFKDITSLWWSITNLQQDSKTKVWYVIQSFVELYFHVQTIDWFPVWKELNTNGRFCIDRNR